MKLATVLPSLSLWIFALLCAILLLHMPVAPLHEGCNPASARLLGHWAKVNDHGEVVLYAQLTGAARVRLLIHPQSGTEQPTLMSEFQQAEADRLYRVELHLCQYPGIAPYRYYWEIEGETESDPLAMGTMPIAPQATSHPALRAGPSPCAGSDVLRPFLHESHSPSAAFSYLPTLRPARTGGSFAKYPST